MAPALLEPDHKSEPWYVRAFRSTYLRVYAHRDEDEAERNAPAIVKLLGVGVDARVLDVACGEGRYARALQRRGMRVTGVDLSPELLQEAREKARALPGAPQYVRCDIRRLPFSRQFDAAVCMFTSFGYFGGQADDEAIFTGVARALVRGGRFLLDFLNAPQVRANFVPYEERRDGAYLLKFARRIEEDAPGGPSIFKRVEAIDTVAGALEADYEERVRLYTCDEIDTMLAGAGLRPVGDPLGDVQGRPFDENAPRLVRVAERVGV